MKIAIRIYIVPCENLSVLKPLLTIWRDNIATTWLCIEAPSHQSKPSGQWSGFEVQCELCVYGKNALLLVPQHTSHKCFKCWWLALPEKKRITKPLKKLHLEETKIY